MNGSLYLQVMQDRCVDCNECAICRGLSQPGVRADSDRDSVSPEETGAGADPAEGQDPANVKAKEILSQVYQS